MDAEYRLSSCYSENAGAPDFVVLASGSRANSIAIIGSKSILLVDCGLSDREFRRRLSLVGLSHLPIAGIVVTHEHSDHVKGIKKIWESCRASGGANIRAYMTSGTAEELSRSFIRQFPIRPGILSSGITTVIGEFEVKPFDILHDAAEPVGLVIQIANGTRIGIATDLGKVTHSVREALRGVNGLIIESNHDPERLLTCRYPWSVKQRIASSRGHLSNQAAASLVAELIHERLHYVVLGHLSEESNTPELAFGVMQQAIQSATLAGILTESPVSMSESIYLATACPRIPVTRNGLTSVGGSSRIVTTISV